MLRRVLVLSWIALLLVGLRVDSHAAEGHQVPDGAVEAALAAAGANRAELERALAHLEAAPDGQLGAAASFLVANMPGRGYVVTELRAADGTPIPYDPTEYDDFAAARAALEALEEAHGELDFARDHIVLDLETMSADYLTRHVENAFRAWRRAPEAERVDFGAFLEYVLPYRGSEEPLDDWLDPLLRRYANVWRRLGPGADRAKVYRWISEDVHRRVRFDERYYLHPTDQSFTEMGRSGLGRCEDITNMITYAARSVGLATAADYTPAWGHRDNNHAWNVLLDPAGRGSDPSNAHAAKVYRKVFSLQADALANRLPADREAPNRFLASRTYVDVTDQYAPTTDVEVALESPASREERFAYICVFNGGAWTAIHFGAVEQGRVVFDRMGRNLLYLPAVHDGEALTPVAAPRLVGADGTVRVLAGIATAEAVALTAVSPRQVSPDTQEEKPVSSLEPGTPYVLWRWAGSDWEEIRRFEATGAAALVEGLPSDGLYWLTAAESRRLERPFTIEGGRQRFW